MLQKSLDEWFYPNYSNNWDDRNFRKKLLEHFSNNSICLDYGAGRGNVEYMRFNNVVAKVCGVDVDKAVMDNPYLHDAKIIDINNSIIPYEDDYFDFVYSDNVMEHVDNPNIIFEEIKRVLKPGGIFFVKTPNKLHYMPLIARFTPTWFHKFYNKKRGREEIDTFPTRYTCNTENTVRSLAQNHEFDILKIDLWEGRPEYLRIFSITYILGILYERIVNNIDLLKKFRVVLYFAIQKK